MVARKDIIPGEKFYRLTVLGEAPRVSGNPHRRVTAQCDCGHIKDYDMALLRSGESKSCGCWRKEFAKTRQKTIRESKGADVTPGERFGFLTVIAEAPRPSGIYEARVIAQCDCGTVKEFRFNMLRSGRTKSCGCWRKASPLTRAKHGHGSRQNKTRVYRIWKNMTQRCANPKNPRYVDYGGRGIKVCDQWLEFENFLADMGEPEADLTLDRYPDVNGNYEPGNCRWATDIEQANNTRRNRFIEFNGRSMTVAQWSAETGIPYGVLSSRINKHRWPVELALTEPVRKT